MVDHAEVSFLLNAQPMENILNPWGKIDLDSTTGRVAGEYGWHVTSRLQRDQDGILGHEICNVFEIQ